jgi:hypothetical protein
MTAALNLNELARISAASLLNCVLDGVGIALFAWVLLRLVGRRNSSTRFAVWFFALLAIAMLPVLGVAASSARLTSAGSAGSAITVPRSWALDIFLVWAAIAGVAVLRVGYEGCARAARQSTRLVWTRFCDRRSKHFNQLDRWRYASRIRCGCRPQSAFSSPLS